MRGGFRDRWVALTVSVLLIASASIAPGSVASAGTGLTNGGDAPGVERSSADALETDRIGPITECFVGDGYPLRIGDPPTTIDALVHLSVMTDPRNGNEFGVELAGTMSDERIVTLAAGVRLNRIGLVATGVNPFAAFDLLYTYEFRLPMFEGSIGESSYAEDRPPISSAAGAAPC